MRPVKIKIEGTFWDSQIYSGELILIDVNGSLHRIDWNEAVDVIAKKFPLFETAVRVSFSDGELFYNPKVTKVFNDPTIKPIVISQLESLSEADVTERFSSRNSFWSEEKYPFSFLPSDTEIYYSRFFAAGEEGLFSTTKSNIGSKYNKGEVIKHHDSNVIQVKASENAGAIAIAAGNDGLFDFPFNRHLKGGLKAPRNIADIPCNICDWAFQSVIGSTLFNSYFVKFREEKVNDKKVRVFDSIISDNEIFGSINSEKNIVWGSREKMYRISSSGLEIVNYNAKNKKTDDFSAKGYFNFSNSNEIKPEEIDDVISTGVAPFGTILEFSDKVLVIRSDGFIDIFKGELVHWRIFPRSEHYSNQLHLIYEDRIEIISFVHDYFVDQENKIFGFSR
ncbi:MULTISPECIES: hypothetical protein [unclassified Serratia (in: enterobacteria)]|uniref:hypothetical protein n=1 Tax=unclassified Serratia (in: enterobacteria) TaxID=2647522 RepID=UPI0018A8B1B2|nr:MULTISPECIES: hypothetical protein [unclassified Serratia (in: enterobacteria)]